MAKRIGTSAPQISRTEKAPENANVKTLMRYAHAIGVELKVKLVPRSARITGINGKGKRAGRKPFRLRFGKRSSTLMLRASKKVPRILRHD